MTNIDPTDFPVLDEIDAAILMHRDVHFGGNFNIMIEYYQSEGKGVQPEFRLERLFELAKFETSMGKNLAPLILEGKDAEKVQVAKKTYEQLSELCEKSKDEQSLPRLLADLILSEEEKPIEEMQAIVSQGKQIVPSLLELLRSETFRDSLFPGYGTAPHLALLCLGMMQNEDAITHIFELIGREEVLEEETAIEVLTKIGKPALKFLLRSLKSLPITEDNERAAIALVHFKDHPEVSKEALSLLQNSDFKKTVPLSNYLILCCEGLVKEDDRKLFSQLEMDPEMPKIAKEDIKLIKKSWNR